ncbi:hypothetical protein RFN29_23920 [Mesorhizobium sp. VK22B]|uniref:Uncharacterized protein n=1 Tax=Mesorhizobium captivum TaxID=3072319 RepID=A0ABU4Z5R7_9HYPH|nr:hypothetical protein [Mesorhizobium sp. VK22B]MDX8494623.1 hypothetical protein [Mesorhizobium sp. VK22B]
MEDDFDPGQFTAEYNTPEGRKLWKILNRKDVVARMETASDLGQAALAAVEEILLEEMGRVILEDRFKQMAGRMTRQILERRGFEHVASDVRLNSVPFYKASRYKRRDRPGLYLFRNSSNPRDICVTDTRNGEKLPALPDERRWIYVNHLDSPLKAQIGFDLNLKAAIAEVQKHGFLRHEVPRLLRASQAR